LVVWVSVVCSSDFFFFFFFLVENVILLMNDLSKPSSEYAN